MNDAETSVKWQPEIVGRNFKFSLRVLQLGLFLLRKTACPKSVCSQLIRAGTSVGANVEESQSAESRKDYVHKLQIAVKELRETNYWIRLIVGADLVAQKRVEPLLNEASQVQKVLGSIIRNTRKHEPGEAKAGRHANIQAP